MSTLLEQDRYRYPHGKLPLFQVFFRRYQESKGLLKLIYRFLYRWQSGKYFIEIPRNAEIAGGLYIGHAYAITINKNSKIGANCNIHKGVTIGQENRGLREGTPIIGDCVWIGINSTIVGHVRIGNDVLIAPNTYINQDIPSHSIVIGNPCIIKHCENATEFYINRKVL